MAQQRGLDRIVNLSDAVVAIAATLLVLPLVDSAQEVSGSGLEVIRENGDNLLAFGLSFVVICTLWLTHHDFYRNVVGFNRALLWANFAWLLSIAFLPFPTELISAGIHDATSNALYIGTILVADAAYLLQRWIVARTPELQDDSVRGTQHLLSTVVGTGTVLVALIVAVAIPAVGLYALLLLVPATVVEGRIARRQSAAGSAPRGPAGA